MLIVRTRLVVVACVHDAAVPFGSALRHVVGFFQHQHLFKANKNARTRVADKVADLNFLIRLNTSSFENR